MRANAARHRFSVIESLLNAWPLGDDLAAFDRWYARGVRVVGFVHAGNNQFADSSRPAVKRGGRPDENGGLSPLGRVAVARLNDLGVLIDVSQLSDRALDQVLMLGRAPVIASYSDVRALVDNPRNLTDAQLDAIAAKGGAVAINAFSTYLRKPAAAPVLGEHAAPDDRASVADLINALDYTVKRIGIDHVALSSDFNHGSGVIGWSDVGELPNVAAGLRRRGYTDAQIGKLRSGDVLRVWQAAIDARRPHLRS